MSSFEEKYDRALVELEQKGLRTTKFRLLNAFNQPFDFCVRKLQLRPIYYASYFEMWLRSAPFYFIVMAAVSLLMLLTILLGLNKNFGWDGGLAL